MSEDLHSAASPSRSGDERRAAIAVLLDEVGACARGELPLPDQAWLIDWLRLLNTVAGSDRADEQHLDED
jgi:hypothetical protein